MKKSFQPLLALALFFLSGAFTVSVFARQPNIIVFFTDDQRMNTLGCYNDGCPIETPNLDRLAAEGIRFTNGFVTTPICMVSRACLLTGRYESHHNIHMFNTEMEDKVFEHIYPVYLKEAGYFVGNVGKYGVGISDEQRGIFDMFEGQSDQGPAFREYKGQQVHDAEWLTLKTVEFLDQVPEDQPFCLQLNYKEPHSTSEPAPEDLGSLADYKFIRSPTDLPEEHARMPELVRTGFSSVCYDTFFGVNGIHGYLSDYYEKIMSVERSVGKIMYLLEERGLADNTVVIFLSDHGTHFGEKQLGGKWTPYEESLRIPFIIYDPRQNARKGVVLDEMVLNIDVAPTLLDLAGLPVPAVMDGLSMKPLIDGKKTKWRTEFFYEHFFTPSPPRQIARNEGMRTENSKYVRWTDLGQLIEEYYRLDLDSMESHNLINDGAYREEINAARKAFHQWREDNPSTYTFNVYGKGAQFGAMEIDWEKFREAKPEVYEKIKTEVERLDVTWMQAVKDWEIRKEICQNVGYWY